MPKKQLEMPKLSECRLTRDWYCVTHGQEASACEQMVYGRLCPRCLEWHTKGFPCQFDALVNNKEA